MIGKFKRKFSRSKSVSQASIEENAELEPEPTPVTRSLTLSPSDEQLISKLAFTPETEIIERPPVNKTTSVATKWSERTVFNNVNSGFLALPTEILTFLQPYLSLSSEVSLRHSCSRFFHLYSTPSFYLKGEELFDFICMTERDQDPTKLDRLACGFCHTLHPRKTFPASEVRQAPRDRDCRQVWLCPHKHLGYNSTIKAIKAGPESPFRAENIISCNRCRDSIRNRFVADRPEKGTSDIDIESPKAESLLISKIALMQAPSPAYNAKSSNSSSGIYKEVFQVKDVSAALQAINFQLCPHLWLGDPPILGKFCRSCINTQKLPPGVKGPPCISESDKKEFGEAKTIGRCKGSCFTRGCRTKFMFQAREGFAPDASGRRPIWLIVVVYRWLGPLLTAERDGNWKDHALKHNDRVEMKNKWMEWERRSRQPCMPNWSICLLHPDDSNLR